MSFWDDRYREPGFAYGDRPNDFVVERCRALSPGSRVLELACGEGRNAVFLAERGHDVVGVDGSAAGLEKLAVLAQARGVTVGREQVDLATADLGVAQWDAVVVTFLHLPSALRARLHGAVVRALRPGGVFLAEYYAPAQVAYGTGGPPDVALLVSPEDLQREASGLVWEHLAAVERAVVEGKYHTGMAAVTQGVGRGPLSG